MNIQIQTTSVCTGSCIMCPYPESWHKKNPGRMTDQVFRRILGELKPLPIRKICPYLENEPLADPQIFERIVMIREAFPAVLIEVSTNALALDKAAARKLIAALQGGPHDIWLSFHGIDKRSFEGIMGIPFEQCLSNIIHLLKEAESHPLTIRIHGAGEGRVPELKHDFSFSKEEYLCFWNEIFQQNGITKKHSIHFFTYHDRARSIHRNDIHTVENVRPDLTGFSCVRVTDWLHFLYTGELILCCMDYQRETVFGDITKAGLHEILKGSEFLSLADKITGECASDENFICKRCISPGG